MERRFTSTAVRWRSRRMTQASTRDSSKPQSVLNNRVAENCQRILLPLDALTIDDYFER
jgi:hypothetical protein